VPLAGDVLDHALALQDLQGPGRDAMGDLVVLGDCMHRRDAADHGPLGDLVSQHLGYLLIRRHRRVRVDHRGQHARCAGHWQAQPGFRLSMASRPRPASRARTMGSPSSCAVDSGRHSGRRLPRAGAIGSPRNSRTTFESAFAGDEPLLRHVRTRVRCPQTNGVIERFFGTSTAPPDRRRRRASDGDRPLPRHLQPHPATPSSRRSNTAPGLPRHVTQCPAEGPVTAARHRAGLARHPVIEPAGDGSQRRSCAGGGSHVRQLGRRPSAPLDMVDCLAATRNW
jgi:hypothetical protein